MRKPRKKALSLLLVVAMLFTLLPISALAESSKSNYTHEYDEGYGSFLPGNSVALPDPKLPNTSKTREQSISQSSLNSGINATAFETTSTSGPIAPGQARVILTAGDVWSDGTGYQMLLDANADTYGTTIPPDNNLSTMGDVSSSIYDEFEYKIPTNADGALATSNIVINDSVAIEIPAGTYDYCITNPTPGDKMYIAGGTLSRGDNYAFEEGKVYTFEVIPNGDNELVTLSVVPADAPGKVTGFTAVPVGQTFVCDLAWTNPAVNVAGETLTELTSMVIERNGTVVHRIDSPEIGASATWTDNTMTDSDVYTYTVYGVNPSGPGEAVSVRAVVGNLALMGSTPLVTTGSILFTDDGGPSGNYLSRASSSPTQVMTFLPDEAEKLVRATFNEFHTVVDLAADALYVVNGNYSQVTGIAEVPDDAIMDELSGDLSSRLPLSYTSDSPDGALTFIFVKKSYGYYASTSGWQAAIDLVTPPSDDAGLTAILSPKSAASASYSVKVKVKNFGSNPITSLDLKYQLDSEAVVTESFTDSTGSLSMLESTDFTFATPITLPNYGAYHLKVWTALPGDEDDTNNALEMDVIYLPGIQLYGYRAYGGDEDFVSFQSNAPETITSEKVYTDGSNNMRGGEYIQGQLYAYTRNSSSGSANFIKLTDSWEQLSSTPTNGIPNDVAFDYLNGTLYAVGGSTLYTIDQETGAFTAVSSLPESFLTLACDLSGQLYGVGVSGGFYSIDKATGAADLIRDTGYTCRYIQSMAFDHTSGRLFWAYIDYDGQSSELIEINPATGDCVELGNLGSTVTEMLMLYSPYINQDIPAAPTAFSATPDSDGGLSCELSWTNPALSTGGSSLTALTSLVIQRNGVTVHTINNPEVGAAASWTDTTMPGEGDYIYTIFAVNSAGIGIRAGAQTVSVGDLSAINNFPWCVGFEENSIPWRWTQEFDSGTVLWTTAVGNGSYPAGAHSGTYNAVFKNLVYTPDVTKLVTPQLDISGMSEPVLKFWYTQTKWQNDQDELRVYYKASAAADWILLATYADNITEWTEQTVVLPDASEDYYIAFEGTAKYGRGIALDDISVEEQTSAPTTFTITFNANGGSVSPDSAVTGTDGKLSDPPPIPTRNGYSFDGWFSESSGGAEITTNTIFTAHDTIYAHWTENQAITYAVSVISAGIGATGGGNYVESETVSLSAGSAPTGMEFDQWVFSPNVTFTNGSADTVEVSFTMPNQAVAAEAVFRPLASTVTEVTVNPASVTLQQGASYQFSAAVAGDNNPDQGVTWTLSGNSSDATLLDNVSGVLDVATDEDGPLTVRATSTVDSQTYGDAIVTVSSTEPAPVTVDSVTITPSALTRNRGDRFRFSAAVSGTNNPSQGVTWEVEGSSGTTTVIATDGTLTIAADETAATLIVKATSTVDSDKFATVTVTVAQPVTTYTITFNANGGLVSPASAVTGTDGKLSELPRPTRNSYSFDGWFSELSGGVEITTSTIFSAHDTVYAHWTYTRGGGGGGGSTTTTTSTENKIINSETWTGITDKAKALKNGGSMTIDMNGTSTVPGSFLEAIVGKDVEVTFDMGSGLSWTVKGTDILGSSQGALNLGARKGTSYIPAAVRNLDGSISEVQLRLTHDGAFGFKLTLNVELGKDNAGSWANLFYYNGDSGELEFCGASKIGSDGKSSFVFDHASDYLIVVSVESLEPTQPEVTQPEITQPDIWNNPFSDVQESDWFYADVEYVVENGLFNGTSATTFSPQTPMTRAMLVTVLWRMQGGPIVDEAGMYANFADVVQGAYYENAVGWAAKNGMVSGYGEGFFGPDDFVTREQFATILYRYTGSPALTAGQLEFADAGEVSTWAFDAIVWATTEGIITGKPGNLLDPQGSATRAEAAAMLQRYLER